MKTCFDRNKLVSCLILLIILTTIPYYFALSRHLSIWYFAAFQFCSAGLCLFYLKKRILLPYMDFLNTLKEYVSENPSIKACTEVSDAEKHPDHTLKDIIKYHQEREKHYNLLLEQLRSSNVRLERYSRITDSIMQITSKLLSSGDINETLQIILDKAIEIIPNAQKGSILIYDGEVLSFRAVRGYDFNVLKNVKFSIKELFQYNSEDFYQPCIICNAESFNRKNLESRKFELLKEGRGFELKSVLSCAILVDGEFYGVINLDNAEDPCAFTEEDKPLIKHLSVQIGIALKNSILIERILYLSRHDSLTGLYNRAYFEELLAKLHQYSKEYGNKFSFLLIDINDLKYANDTFGHEAGDLLLRSFVKGVRSYITENDIFARLGGDEFALVFINQSRSDVEIIAERIKADFQSKPFTYCGSEIGCIGFGYGISVFPDDAVDLDELLKLADKRMYENKKKAKSLFD